MSYKFIAPGSVIGIIGGGQLGRMMGIAAKEMGYRIAVLDPVEDSPCGQIADIKVIGNYDDQASIRELAEVSDVVTYEFENINAEMLNWLEENAYVPQGSHLLTVTQNRELEKKTIVECDLKVPYYEIVHNETEFFQAIEKVGLPCVIKTCRGGYDGKGQILLRKKEDLPAGLELAQKTTCIVEEWMTIDKEISVIVQRNGRGETVCLPVAENIHRHHILHQTIVPARISPVQEAQATEYAIQLADSLELIGTLAVEMFVNGDGEIYINEMAPRPHNSGHFSINACRTSQFQQHIRAICNWPLSSTQLVQSAVMINLLGEHMENLEAKIEYLNHSHLHLYGKKEAKLKRKMGHITVIADKIDEALLKAESLELWTRTEEPAK
ncbi:5-(carboxyamino)imidazole ribonucleotide synthase [Priestia koreensis]|uniref:5-(carboxyamino)imidazole ribonucleotide synthase n=1 Tax=Priestia koreensis TaxID=284581 RepID=UPI0025599350|nr:5-(carboxyamino)imidazole ribonucleotide synthase [Priestia koreensis]